jgi:hypothetical protein
MLSVIWRLTSPVSTADRLGLRFTGPAATFSLVVEFVLIALLLGGAFFIQSRKKDFI